MSLLSSETVAAVAYYCHLRLRSSLYVCVITALAFTLWAGLANVEATAPWFVSKSGNDTNDCQTYATACLTVGAAITKASAGDVIIIASGLYTESITLDKNLTLIGFGSDATILSGMNVHQVLLISSNVSANVYDLAIVYGNNNYGGGILNLGSLTLVNILLSSNYGGVGGAIRNEGTLVVNSSIISGNVSGSGGGISNIGSAIINRSSIDNNDAFVGGGLINVMGTMSVYSTTILSNTATEEGGGIDNSSILYVNKSTIANNALCGNHCTFSVSRPPQSKAPDNGIYTEGAGIFTYGGALTITNSTISGNNAPYGDSGGMVNNSPTVISNTTISGNTANYAAGIYNVLVLTLTNVTISGNVNEGLRTYGTTWMRNTISGDGCAGSGMVVSLGHNLASDSSCNLTAAGDLTNTNPLLGPLQDNGGPTPTHALLAGSPAINHGDNAGCPPTDQRGVTRPQAGTCDIGAYEYVFPFTLIMPVIRR
jgi:hypothetical protein